MFFLDLIVNGICTFGITRTGTLLFELHLFRQCKSNQSNQKNTENFFLKIFVIKLKKYHKQRDREE